MKLYSADLSPYSAKVRMQIYAMGIEDEFSFELPLLDFISGQLKNVSPLGRIPILKTETAVIPESEVICEYIDECYPDRAILGASPDSRAAVRVLSRIADIYLLNNIFLMLISRLDAEHSSPETEKLLIKQILRGFDALEQHIGPTDFAAGDNLTRADCSLVPALFLCESSLSRFEIDNPIDKHPKVAAYWTRIKSNPHAERVITEMTRGLKARLDGTEQRMIEEAMAQAKEAVTTN